MTTCLPRRQWEKWSWTLFYFPGSSEKRGQREGEKRGRKGNVGEKKNGCGYQKDLAHLLRFLLERLKAVREGGGSSLGSVTPHPLQSLKMNPIEWEGWSDTGTARNKALTGLKRPPFCATTNTSLSELTAGGTEGSSECPLFSAAAAHSVNVSFTCRTLRTTPPLLAGVRRHGQLDPQRLTAAGRMVDGGVDDLVDGVEQAGDVLQRRG